MLPKQNNSRYNNKLTRWDSSDEDVNRPPRRNLDYENYGLKFEPVTAADTGTYLCLLNNRREPDSQTVLTVQGMDFFLQFFKFYPIFKIRFQFALKYNPKL